MQFFSRIVITLGIFLALITFAQSETTWITKKKKDNKAISFCVQKSQKSSFGYAVTVLENSSICENKDIVVSNNNNNNKLYNYLLSKYDSKSGVFFIKDSTLSKYKSNETIKVAEKKSKNWIKKKDKEKKEKVKQNKKKLKQKIKESKSWITKKSKDKIKNIKKNLKKHKNIEDLPKADFYFAAVIQPIDEGNEPQYLYGYVKSNKKSSTFKFNNQSFYSLSDGIAYFENKKNRCEVDTQLIPMSSLIAGNVHLKCKKNKQMSGGFFHMGDVIEGIGDHWNGNKVKYEFFTSKESTIEKLNIFKRQKTLEAGLGDRPSPGENKSLPKPPGKYYALLIGNSNYVNWASLTSPKNDVTEIEKVLKSKYQFEKIITILNGTEKDIMKGFKKLSKITTEKDYVLIYYSGHGNNRRDQNYWIPVDAESDYGLGDWINTAEIQNYIMDEIPNHHIVLMSDSCYFNVGTKGNQDIENRKSISYEKLLSRRAIMVSQSGSNEPVLDLSDDKHSMYGKSFIESLKNNNSVIRISKIFEEIYLSHHGMKQLPQWQRIPGWGDRGGDFLFIAKK